MIDKKKRLTLKTMTAAASATLAVSLPAVSVNSQTTNNTPASAIKRVRQVWPPLAVKTPLDLTTQVSDNGKNVEVVLTNTSTNPVTITQITPTRINTLDGTFDLETVPEASSRHLIAGENIRVTLKIHASNDGIQTLRKSIHAGLSVSTDAHQFSPISYALVV